MRKINTIKLRSISIGLVTVGVASVTWWLTYSSAAFAPNFPFYSQQSELDFSLTTDPLEPLEPLEEDDADISTDSSEIAYTELEFNVQAGDTMVSLFEQHQLNPNDLYRILQLEQHKEQLSRLRLGQQISVIHDEGRIIDLSLQLAADKLLVVYRNDFGFSAEVLQDGEPILTSLAAHVAETPEAPEAPEAPASTPVVPVQTLAQIAQAAESRNSFNNNRLELTVQRGDTLYKIFRQHNLSLADLDRILKLHRQSRTYLHNLRINNKLTIERTNQNRIKSMTLVVDNNNIVHINRNEGKFQARLEQNGQMLAFDQPARPAANTPASRTPAANTRVASNTPATRTPVPSTPANNTRVASNNTQRPPASSNTNNRTARIQPATPASPSTIAAARSNSRISPNEFRSSPAQSNDPRLRQMLSTAKNYLGSPYVYGGQTPRGFDCSGFVVYNTNKVGIEVPRTAHQQYNHTTPVKKSELRPGDLVFFNDSRRRGRIGHVGIYIGDNRFIHARSGGAKDVTISDLDNSYYSKHFVRGGRL